MVEVEGRPFKHTDPDGITERLLIPLMEQLGIKGSKKAVKTLMIRQTYIGQMTCQFLLPGKLLAVTFFDSYLQLLLTRCLGLQCLRAT